MEEMLRDVVKEQRKTNFRQYVIVIILIASLVVTNGYWIWQNGQWEYETVMTESYGDSTNITNLGSGDINNGSENSDKKKD